MILVLCKKMLFAIFVLQFYLVSAMAEESSPADGVVFICSVPEIEALARGMESYLSDIRISEKHYRVRKSQDGRKLSYSLTTPDDDTNTLDLNQRPEYRIYSELMELPRDRSPKEIVSRKEIVLALFQHGRLTKFKGKGCNIQAFKDHVGIRQNISAWVDSLHLIFPTNSPSHLNPTYWKDYDEWGTNPEKFGSIAIQGLHDIFMNPKLYRIGCLLAAKVSLLHGITDYFTRIRPDQEKLNTAIHTLFAYGSPLEDPEPGYIWSDFRTATPEELSRKEGKFLEAVTQVAKFHFVPGDWAYFKNTDYQSSEVPGLEGSNAIYLGGNKFGNFYHDRFDRTTLPLPAYTTEQKVSLVASWGRKVPEGIELSKEEVRKQMEPPDRDRDGFFTFSGGYLLTHRLTPRVF